MSTKKLAQRIHHISSHFTNGLFPAAAALITLFLLTENVLFEHASLCCCIIGTIAAPIVCGSGLFDWRIRFGKRPAQIFTRKRTLGTALVLLSIALIVFRLSLGTELATAGVMKYFYAGGIYILTAMVMYLGYLGGKFIV